jgi:hypothetical protein
MFLGRWKLRRIICPVRRWTKWQCTWLSGNSAARCWKSQQNIWHVDSHWPTHPVMQGLNL